jgi:replicative DNA helicase
MAERLQSGSGDREKVSSSYLIELIEASPLTQNIEYYAELIKNKHYLRRIIDACNTTVKRAYASDGDINSFIEQVEKEFLTVASDQDRGKGLVTAKEALIPTLEELERRITSVLSPASAQALVSSIAPPVAGKKAILLFWQRVLVWENQLWPSTG